MKSLCGFHGISVLAGQFSSAFVALWRQPIMASSHRIPTRQNEPIVFLLILGTTTGAVYALSQRRLVKRDRKADHRYWKALRKSEKQDRKAERRYDHLLYRNP